MRAKRHFWLLILPLVGLLLSLTSATASADGGAPNLAYVAGTAKGVTVIDVAQQKVTNSLATGGNPQMILLSLDARFLYSAQPQAGKVTITAAKTGEKVCDADVPGEPRLLTLDYNSNLLFAAGSRASSVSVIDPTNCTVKRTIQTSGPVYGLAIAAVGPSLTSGNGNQLWVSEGDSLAIYDDAKGTKITSFALPGAGYLSIPPGATVYATTRSGQIVAVDLNSRNVIPLITGGPFGPMDYDATTGEIYVPDIKNNRLIVLAPVNAGFAPPKEPNRMISVDTSPTSVAITSDGQLAFVALQGGKVTMLDIPGKQVITTFAVGGDPQFIITGLYPPAVGTTPQQATLWTNIATIGAYIFVVALLIVPIFLFRRYAKAREKAEAGKKD